eukprot:685897-Rhodomonas_salina.1
MRGVRARRLRVCCAALCVGMVSAGVGVVWRSSGCGCVRRCAETAPRVTGRRRGQAGAASS